MFPLLVALTIFDITGTQIRQDDVLHFPGTIHPDVILTIEGGVWVLKETPESGVTIPFTNQYAYLLAALGEIK